jgi:four helix bundle protein
MATLTRFEDLDCWKKARVLASEIYAATEGKSFSRDHGLREQIRRAAVSAMSNVAEGFDRGGNREFLQFLWVARGSAAEVRSQLYVALDAGHLQQQDFDRLAEQTIELSKVLAGLTRYLEDSDRKGRKFDQA